MNIKYDEKADPDLVLLDEFRTLKGRLDQTIRYCRNPEFIKAVEKRLLDGGFASGNPLRHMREFFPACACEYYEVDAGYADSLRGTTNQNVRLPRGNLCKSPYVIAVFIVAGTFTVDDYEFKRVVTIAPIKNIPLIGIGIGNHMREARR